MRIIRGILGLTIALVSLIWVFTHGEFEAFLGVLSGLIILTDALTERVGIAKVGLATVSVGTSILWLALLGPDPEKLLAILGSIYHITESIEATFPRSLPFIDYEGVLRVIIVLGGVGFATVFLWFVGPPTVRAVSALAARLPSIALPSLSGFAPSPGSAPPPVPTPSSCPGAYGPSYSIGDRFVVPFDEGLTI